MMMKRRLFIMSLLWPSLVNAHSFSHGNIAIGHAWALPSTLSDGQVFVPLSNHGNQRDELIAARSIICRDIELRQNNRYDDQPLQSFVLDPRKPLPMRPTARHLRLTGLKKALRENDQFPLILDFLNAGEVEITVIVEAQPGD